MKIRHAVLSGLVKAKGIKSCQLGKASNYLALPTISSILNGWISPGKKRSLDLLAGLKTLGFTPTEIAEVFMGHPPED